MVIYQPTPASPLPNGPLKSKYCEPEYQSPTKSDRSNSPRKGSEEPRLGEIAIILELDSIDDVREHLSKLEDSSVHYVHSSHLRSTTILRKAIFIMLSLAAGIGINVYNTFLFSKNHLDLGHPFFVSTIFDLTQLALALLTLTLMEWKTGPGVIGTYQMLTNDRFFKFLLPCGVAAALNIALSNASLQHISLSFYTMVKSCSPVFVLIFAFFFGLERPNQRLFAIIGVILIGILLTVYDAVDFNMFGFTLILSAAVVSGLRWTMTQIIIAQHSSASAEDPDGVYKAGPLKTMVFLAPIVGSTLALMSLTMEGPKEILNSPFFGTFGQAIRSWGFGLFGGLLTFVLVLLEYKVIQETSVLTFAVLGIVKELLIIGLSIVIFGDRIKMINIVGALITVAGILLYQFHKVNSRSEDQPPSSGERRRRRITDAAMTHMFASAPPVEPPLAVDFSTSEESDESNNSSRDRLTWGYAPNVSPVKKGASKGDRLLRSLSWTRTPKKPCPFQDLEYGLRRERTVSPSTDE